MFPCRDNFSPSRHCFHGKLWNYPFIAILKVGKMSQLEEDPEKDRDDNLKGLRKEKVSSF